VVCRCCVIVGRLSCECAAGGRVEFWCLGVVTEQRSLGSLGVVSMGSIRSRAVRRCPGCVVLGILCVGDWISVGRCVIIRCFGGVAFWSLGVVAGSGVTLGSLKTSSWSRTGFGVVLRCFGEVTGCCLCCHG
jgi:hypothetical protein